MKLSEAIERGSHILQPMAGTFVSYDGVSGCALGMAFTAERSYHRGACVSLLSLNRVWPILNQFVVLPCGCSASNITLSVAITHLFDNHVMDMDSYISRTSYSSRTTLAELIAFVARIEAQQTPVEPAEPEEVVEVEEAEELQCV